MNIKGINFISSSRYSHSTSTAAQKENLSESPEVQENSFKEVRQALELRALHYFLDHGSPLGFVRDRARNFGATLNQGYYRMASMAATGFGIAVLVNAALRNLTPRLSMQSAERLVLRTLESARNLPHHKGWLYHFVDWESGERFGKSEVSTIDTAFFIAGALYAAEFFPRSRIREIAYELYGRIDFQAMMNNGGEKPTKHTLSMGWTPEGGYLKSDWESYSELTLLLLLGLGHPKQPLPEVAWKAWKRPYVMQGSGRKLLGYELPLFVHQYSHLFVDFRELKDRVGPLFFNYFENSKIATLRDREFSLRNHFRRTYREGFWGRSACDSLKGYRAFSPVKQDGTVCPSCAGASAMFAPNVVLPDLQRWMTGAYRDSILGKYGFADALNLDQEWIDQDVLGITLGSLYLALANLDPRHSVWGKFNEIKCIKKGLRQAGLV